MRFLPDLSHFFSQPTVPLSFPSLSNIRRRNVTFWPRRFCRCFPSCFCPICGATTFLLPCESRLNRFPPFDALSSVHPPVFFCHRLYVLSLFFLQIFFFLSGPWPCITTSFNGFDEFSAIYLTHPPPFFHAESAFPMARLLVTFQNFPLSHFFFLSIPHLASGYHPVCSMVFFFLFFFFLWRSPIFFSPTVRIPFNCLPPFDFSLSLNPILIVQVARRGLFPPPLLRSIVLPPNLVPFFPWPLSST